jgi:hypothetical protein
MVFFTKGRFTSVNSPQRVGAEKDCGPLEGAEVGIERARAGIPSEGKAFRDDT